jgi:formamidopyrimidine-DNA glycosylase
MPELPEVETLVRGLRPALLGKRLTSVWSSGQRLRMRRRLDLRTLQSISAGGRIRRLRRKGKVILVDLDRGGLLVHLGMTGRLRLHRASDPREKHTHVVWSLPGQRELRFVDPRRFGWVQAAADVDALPEVRNLGSDPLAELDVRQLSAQLASSRAPIKAFLLDQRRIAGLGNIYAGEALFRARVHPRAEAAGLVGQAAALLEAIRVTLEIAIANCGTTFRDFVDSSGQAGRNAQALLVYGRAGKTCSACRHPVHRQVDGGRSTFFCPRCQLR